MTTEIFTAGFPRSGNTWLARMVADLFSAPLQDKPDSKPLLHFSRKIDDKYVVRKTHMEAKDKRKENKYIYIVRDPRDVMVSIKYFYHTGDYYRAMGYMNASKYIEYITSWNARGADFVCTYEQLQADCPSCLYAMQNIISGDGKQENAQAVCERHHFTKYSHKYPHLMRNGVVGEWKKVFDREMGKRFEELFGDVLIFLGYEQVSNWWTSLPLDPSSTVLCANCGNAHDGYDCEEGWLCEDCYLELESQAFHDGQRKSGGAPARMNDG